MVDKPIDVRLVTAEGDITKQLVMLGVSAVAAIGIMYMQQKMSGPDAFLSAKMRVLHNVQEYADSRARYWHTISAKATTLYLESRT